VVYDVTGSGALLGAVLGVRVIPLLLLAPLSGVAADRFNRRRLMQASQALAAAVSFAVGAALAFGVVNVWMLFVFTLLMGASNVLDRPARLTTAFDLVPRDAAVKAVTLNTIGFSVTRVIGPGIAGYLIAWLGAAGCFFIQGTLYAASGLVVIAIIFPPREKPQGRSALADMVEGLRFAASDPSMRVLIAIGALPYLLIVPIWGTLFPIYAKDVFSAGPEGLGILLTAVGVGGTLGGFVANALARVQRQALMQAGWILVMALAVFGVASSPSVPIAAAFAFVGGMAEMAHTASNMASMQLAAPQAMRGRVASLMMLYPAMISMGAFLAGPLSDALGVRGASMLLAAVSIMGTAALYFFSSHLREMRTQ
jgi:predicted MFS family arabinose efflux permease